MMRVVAGVLQAFPDAYFFVLTPDVDEACSLGECSCPKGRLEIRRAAHAEVPLPARGRSQAAAARGIR